MKSCLAVLALVLLVVPAAAATRTRDDVMAGAFRCAAAGEARVWLDCFYGAAQPMRAALRLPPASPAQVQLAANPPATEPAALMGRARDEVMSQAFHCTGLDDDRQWLDCYYAAAQPMRAFLNLPAAPQARTALAVPAPPPAPRPAPTRNDDHVISPLASYRFDAAGIFTVTLANGETWRQVSGDTAFAKFVLPAGRYTATIQKGFFGSYNMTVHGVPGLFRVLRVR